MPLEKATALVVRTSDWSETSRIATLFTREFGKVRVLAKGGRRLRSSFEVSLDLLTLCNIVVILKQGGLDLLTEARLEERFMGLRSNLPCLYSGYYIAELLGEGAQDHDPHPHLFDSALESLRNLNKSGGDAGEITMRFELAWLNELGYRPRLDACAVCGSTEGMKTAERSAFSVVAGGLLCSNCGQTHRDRRWVSRPAVEKLRDLSAMPHSRSIEMTPLLQAELRQVFGQYVSFVLGRKPRLLAYLE